MLEERLIEYYKKLREEGQQEGRLEGRLEGRQEGRLEGIKETARRLLAKGIDPEIVEQCTGFKPEDVL